MVHLLSTVHLISAFLLIALILIQRANTDASGAFGADGGNNASLKKRGAEKTLHTMTILSAVVFSVSLALPLFL